MKYSTRTRKTREQLLDSHNDDLTLFEKLVKKHLEESPELTLGRAGAKAIGELNKIKAESRESIRQIKREKKKARRKRVLSVFQSLNYSKIFTMVSVIVFLVILNKYLNKIAQNGRYQKFDNSEIIDTRTGNVYWLDENTMNGFDYERPEIPYDLR